MELGLQFCTECGSSAPRATEVTAPQPPAASQWDSTLVAGAPPLPAYDDFAAPTAMPPLPQQSKKLPLIVIGIGILATGAVVLLLVLKPFSNHPPGLEGIDASQLLVHSGDSVTLTARATDPNDDLLTYRWMASAGQIIGDGSTVRLSTAGAVPGSARIDIRVHVTVSDGRGETASADQTISVQPALVASADPPTIQPELNSNPQSTPDLSNDANSTLNANQPRPVTQATLRLSSSIEGATVLVDGVPRGTVSLRRAKVLRLSPGSHTVLAQKPGYRVWSRPVNLATGVTETLSIEMEPLGPTSDEVASRYLQQAERFIQQGNYDDAISACDEGLRLAVGNSRLAQKREEIERARQRRLDSLREEEERRRKLEADEKRERERAVPVERFQSAVKKKIVKPDYPAIARISRVYGKVIVEVTINEQGAVSDARAIDGPQVLRTSAVNAAKQWKFEPARRGNRVVVDTMKIEFIFTP